MKTAKKLLGLLVTLAMFLLASCSQAPTPAEGLEPAYTIDSTIYAKGWVWANVPNSSVGVAYTPNPLYQYNNRIDRTSTGTITYPAADNKVIRRGLGNYEVIFPNLGVRGGVVHVSAYGGKHICKVVRWDPALDKSLKLQVRCFNPRTGANVNGRFTALFYKDGAKSREYADAYLWADKASITSIYTPSLNYNYNSRGVNNRVKRAATGEYIVTIPQMDVSGGLVKPGTVMVTAYGENNTYCKTIGYSNNATNGITVVVHCYKSGILEDSQFTLSYFRDPSTLAIRNASDKLQAWYLWANPENMGYQSDSYGNSDATMERLAVGSYRVHLPRIAAFDKTFAQVNGYDLNTSYCNVVNWIASPSGGIDVNVKCYTPSGALADSIFSLYYTSDDPR
jgi:hypothetical protein